MKDVRDGLNGSVGSRTDAPVATPALLRSIAFTFACTAIIVAAQAQGTDYYVDGTTGFDSPVAGTSQASPWRTISYAVDHAAATVAAPATIHIAGGQTYSQGTNGEAFPINLPPHVSLAGQGGPLFSPAVLMTGAGVPGIIYLNPIATYGPQDCLLTGLVFQSESTSVLMGAHTGFSHSISLTSCSLSGANSSGVTLIPQGGSASIRMEDVKAHSISCAIRFTSPSPASAPSITISKCQFSSCNSGIIAKQSASLNITDSSFSGCQTGISAGTSWDGLQHISIESCSFISCHTGMSIRGDGMNPVHHVSVSNSWYSSCTKGVELGMSMAMGAPVYSFDAADCSFRNCGTAIWGYSDPTSSVSLHIARCCFVSNSISVDLTASGDMAYGGIDCSQCVFHGGASGIRVYIDTDVSHCDIRSSQFTLIQGAAIDFFGFLGAPMAPTHVHYSFNNNTFADCGTALTSTALGELSEVHNCIFDANTVDLITPPGLVVEHSLSSTSTLPGTTNLSLTNPQLLRPSYKLSPSSPCIDAGDNLFAPATDYEGDLPQAGQVGGPVIVDIGADEFASAGSLHAFGVTAAGPQSARPHITPLSATAPIGSTFTVGLTDAAVPGSTSSLAFLAAGFADSANLPLFDLGVIGMSGSLLWIDPSVFPAALLVGQLGTASYNESVPNATQLIGLPVFYQWLVVRPDGSLVSSDALRATLGQ